MQVVHKLALTLMWMIATAFILAASAASAETYPPGVDQVTAGTDDDTPDAGSSTNVSSTVTDADGNPVAGATVTFTITSNPGDASFNNGQQTITAVTDENGVATVVINTGQNPGTIVVRVDASGIVAQVTLTTGTPQALPKTGGDPAGAATHFPLTVTIAAGVALMVAAVGAAGVRRLRTSGS